MTTPQVSGYPHVGGCNACRTAGVCNWCGTPTKPTAGKCTNGRCRACHAAFCTPGGDVSPGHGYGASPRRWPHFTGQVAP